jgi:tetratricopeptide (TPR) repeat protein
MNQKTAAAMLEEAVRWHQAGALREAEPLYRDALAIDPSRADGWYLLGRVALGLENLDEAEAQFRRCLELLPGFAEGHSHLALALHAQGRLDEAGRYYEEARRLDPSNPETALNFGNTLKALGRLDDAATSYREALRLNPEFTEAYSNLGLALKDLGRLDEAEACHRQALRLRPNMAELETNLGLVLSDLGRLDEAVECHTHAVQLRPDFAEAHGNLASTLAEIGRFDEALAAYKVALRLKSDFPAALSNCGNALTALGRLDEAEACHRRALDLDPDFGEAYGNLGTTLADQGRYEEALASYEEAPRHSAINAEVHFNRALTLLLTGDFARGWPEYEWRWNALKTSPPATDAPRWDGAPLEGRTIVLYSEQGLGDTLQFVRYAALVKERGGTVVVACQRPLRALLKSCPGIDRLVAVEDPLPSCDFQAPLMSLPLIFGTTATTIPNRIPYLDADSHLVDHWRDRLNALSGRKVGMVWQGNLQFRKDRFRSIALAAFEPLAQVAGITLVVLQKNAGREQLNSVADHWPVVDLGDCLDTTGDAFIDTAAVMKNLDLVVTSDTSVAHLAGALGVPVWIALASSPDWRWLLNRSDSPWYPSARLFRQTQRGDWDGVFREMATEIILATDETRIEHG